MRLSLRTVLCALAVSNVPQQVFSRALPQAGPDGNVEKRQTLGQYRPEAVHPVCPTDGL